METRTRKLPRIKWTDYFEEVTERLAARSVNILVNHPDVGPQPAATKEPFGSIAYDAEGDAIDITAGELTHRIVEPAQVFVKEGAHGQLVAVEVVDGKGRQLIAELTPYLTLPPPPPGPTIGELMTRNPITVEASTTLAAARDVMTDSLVRHLPVVEGSKLVGILAERELDLVEALAEFTPDGLLVTIAMQRDPLVVRPNDAARDVLLKMGDHRIGSAVVMAEGEVVGIFTAVDAIYALADAIG